MKVVLENVGIFDKKADGTALINKKGEAYKQASITVSGERYGMYLGKFSDRDEVAIRTWKIGDEVDVILFEKDGYKNFKIPTSTDLLEERVAKLEFVVFGDKKLETREEDISQIPF